MDECMNPAAAVAPEKAKSRRQASPSEEAAIITKIALGESNEEIATDMDRSVGFVARRRVDPVISKRIEQVRLELREEYIEDFGQVVILATAEMNRRLADSGEAKSVSDKDLAGISRHFYNMMKLEKGEPTSISEVQESSGAAFVNGVMLGIDYEANYEKRKRAEIAQVIPISVGALEASSPDATDVVEGEVVDGGSD